MLTILHGSLTNVRVRAFVCVCVCVSRWNSIFRSRLVQTIALYGNTSFLVAMAILVFLLIGECARARVRFVTRSRTSESAVSDDVALLVCGLGFVTPPPRRCLPRGEEVQRDREGGPDQQSHRH